MGGRESALFAGDERQGGLWFQVRQKLGAALDETAVLIEIAVNVGQGYVIEENDELALSVEVGAERKAVWVFTKWEFTSFDLDTGATRKGEISQSDVGLV
ncbi:hypothetical protein D3C72_1426910 [compost metagenome]